MMDGEDGGCRRWVQGMGAEDSDPSVCSHLMQLSFKMLSMAAGGCSAATYFTKLIRPHRLLWSTRFPPGSSFSSLTARASNLDPPDLPRLAEAARISLSPSEVEEFAPKIKQVIDWFGQLQDINLEQVQPSFRADTEVAADPRDDCPETFGNRDAILEAIPKYDDPYIRVPKVVNKD